MNDQSNLLQQEISFLIHTNLLNDFMTLIEGYSQLESSNFPLAIERISHTKSNDNRQVSTFSHRSPFIQRILSNTKNHRTYRITREKPTTIIGPSLMTLTRQFFTRNTTKSLDIDEQETVSNVPNRTTLITWRSLTDANTTSIVSSSSASASPSPPPPPVVYRTVINVQSTGNYGGLLTCFYKICLEHQSYLFACIS
jgi:hypothetical protein